MAYKNTQGLILRLIISCVIGGLLISIFIGIRSDIFTGVTTGILFVLFMGIGFYFLSVVPFSKNEKYANELKKNILQVRSVICDGPANYLKNKKTIVGWLFLSADALEFYSSKQHSSTDESLPILLDNIEEVDVQNKQLIIYTEMEEYKFAVYKPKLWKQSITDIL